MMADGKEVESDTDSLNVCPSELEGEHLEDREDRIYVCTAKDWETELLIPSPSRIKSWHRNAIRSEPCTIDAITAELEEYEIERGDGYTVLCGFCDSEFGSVSEVVHHLRGQKHRNNEHRPRAFFERYFSKHPGKEPGKLIMESLCQRGITAMGWLVPFVLRKPITKHRRVHLWLFCFVLDYNSSGFMP